MKSVLSLVAVLLVVVGVIGCGDTYEVTLVVPVSATASSSGVGGAGGQDDTTASAGGAGGQGGDTSTSTTSVGAGGHGGGPISVGVGAQSSAASSSAASSSSTGPYSCDWMVCQKECEEDCFPQYKGATGNCNVPPWGCMCLCVGQN